MGIGAAFSALRVGDYTTRIRVLYCLAGLLYPAWHAFSPAGASDPWLAWWLISAAWIAAVLLTRIEANGTFASPNLLPVSTWLVTLHFFVLAAVNDMHPFYAVGSAMAVLTAFIAIPNPNGMLAYTIYVATLAGGLFVGFRNPIMLAYWGGLAPILLFGYYYREAQSVTRRVAAQYRDRLESQVADRTRELRETNERLRAEVEQRKQLESELRISHQLEAVGRLSAAVSHEFNNLLCTIGIYSDLMLEKLSPASELRAEIGQIQHAHRQATAITRQLLALSRPSQARLESVSVNAVIERMRPAFLRMLGCDVTLACHLAPDPCLVWANPDVIEQILVNLALNARDAIVSDGTFVLTTSASDSQVVLEVTDSGVGMDATTLEHAFDPFYTTKAAGTGLGLSIVHTLVTQTSGSVQIESARGRGTTFRLTWPRALAETRAANVGSEDLVSQSGNETILVVEDQKELRDGLRRILTSAGYRVLEAPDGAQALAVASERGDDIQLVVSDVVMPSMGGFELAERLSAERPELPVLFVSGQLRHPSVRGRELPVGASLLEKPFSPRDLRSRVRKMLDARPTSHTHV